MMHRPLLLLSIVIASNAVSTGRRTCPCVNVTEELNMTDGCLDAMTSKGYYCYPIDYGSSFCAAHDSGLEPYCAETNASYCSAQWCYVDAQACHSSKVRYYASSVFSDMYYSYTTCDSEFGTWGNAVKAEFLRGKVLRAAIPLSRYSHYHINSSSGEPTLDHVDNDYSSPVPDYTGGYQIEFFNYLAGIAGFTFEWKLVSGGNREAYTSSWDACVADVGDGLIDVCPSFTMTTSYRMGMASFTQPITTSDFRLMVPVPRTNDNILRHFKLLKEPLSNDLWGLLLGLVVFVTGLSILLSPRETNARNLKTSSYLCHEDFLDQVQDSLHSTFMALLNVSSEVDNDDLLSVKLVKSGWQIFILFTLLLYSAQLVATMVETKRNLPVSSMQDCINIRCTVCVDWQTHAHIQPEFTDTIKFEIQTGTLSTVEAFAWSYNKMKIGSCDAAVLEVSQYEDNEAFHTCDYGFVGPAVYQIGKGYAINNDMVGSLSYWIRNISTVSTSKVLEDIRAVSLPPMKCPMEVDTNIDNNQVGPMTLIAPIIMMGALFIAGIGVHCHHACSGLRGSVKQTPREGKLVPVSQAEHEQGVEARWDPTPEDGIYPRAASPLSPLFMDL